MDLNWKEIAKDKEFREVLSTMIEEAFDALITHNGIDADNVNDLDDKVQDLVEETIVDGTFEITFSK